MTIKKIDLLMGIIRIFPFFWVKLSFTNENWNQKKYSDSYPLILLELLKHFMTRL